MTARLARMADAAAIAAIYNDGIADRVATFETVMRSPAEIEGWFADALPLIVVEDAAQVLGFARASSYRDRACYAGIGEFSVYVARAARGQGVGRLALMTLIDASERAGFWKLLSRIFVENHASRALVARCGFREVGVYRCHGRLDGAWRDVVIVERLLGSAASEAARRNVTGPEMPS